MALLLDRTTIQGLLDMDKMIEILEQAFGELASGSAVMPQTNSCGRRRRKRLVRVHAGPVEDDGRAGCEVGDGIQGQSLRPTAFRPHWQRSC